MVDPTSSIPSVGASGAIAGALSGYVLLFPRGLVRVLLFLGLFMNIARVPALLFIGFWFVIQFFIGIVSFSVNTAETGGVAYWAHIGGFVAGLVLAPLLKIRR
ncbi:MAG: rhomboid family intramembrane serine protease [Thaumarchaeota archaeon]|nr:rhomboid family intramembrane serine protease [Nitrososphaerota archaeon]